MLIDSSSIIKYFTKEQNWHEVWQYIIVSETLPFALDEFGNALFKKLKSQEIDIVTATDILVSYQADVITLETSEYRSKALEIATKHNLAFYDSIFLAAAIKEKTTLVTSDKRQADVAQSIGITVKFIQ